MNEIKRTQTEIISDMQTVGAMRDRHNAINNEGAKDGFNPHEETLAKLSLELEAARKAESPLAHNLAAERAWFNAQGFTSANIADANKACLARGYSFNEFVTACKAAK